MAAPTTVAFVASLPSPAPTSPPIAPILGRDRAPNLCGYFDGNADSPYLCATSDICVSDDDHGVIGCIGATASIGATSSIITECVGYDSSGCSSVGPQTGCCESACKWYTYIGPQVEGYTIAVCDSDAQTAVIAWEPTRTVPSLSQTLDPLSVVDTSAFDISNWLLNDLDIDTSDDVTHLAHAGIGLGIEDDRIGTTINNAVDSDVAADIAISNNVKSSNHGSFKAAKIDNVVNTDGDTDIENNVNSDGGADIENNVTGSGDTDIDNNVTTNSDTDISNNVDTKGAHFGVDIDNKVKTSIPARDDAMVESDPPPSRSDPPDAVPSVTSTTTTIPTATSQSSSFRNRGGLTSSDKITLGTALGVGLPATVAGVMATWITMKVWRKRRRQELADHESGGIKKCNTMDSEVTVVG